MVRGVGAQVVGALMDSMVRRGSDTAATQAVGDYPSDRPAEPPEWACWAVVDEYLENVAQRVHEDMARAMFRAGIGMEAKMAVGDMVRVTSKQLREDFYALTDVALVNHFIGKSDRALYRRVAVDMREDVLVLEVIELASPEQVAAVG